MEERYVRAGQLNKFNSLVLYVNQRICYLFITLSPSAIPCRKAQNMKTIVKGRTEIKEIDLRRYIAVRCTCYCMYNHS